MNTKLMPLLSLLIVVSSFFSCDYNYSDTHYVEVEKRPDNIPIQINLSDVNEDQVIYIYKPATIYFQVDAGALPLLNIDFKLDNNSLPISFTESQGYIRIEPSSYNNSIHDLTLDVEIRSNSGSLADKLLLERYLGHMEFKVKYLPTPDININIKQEKTPDNYLKLVWDKPIIEHAEVDYYEVNGVKVNTEQYVDENYVYGYQTYEITVHYKNDKLSPMKFIHTATYTLIKESEFVFEDIDVEKVKVTWPKNDFTCKYVYRTAKGVLISSETNSAIIDRPAFPYELQTSFLYILPKNAATENYERYYYVYNSYHAPQLGGDFSSLIYDKNNKISMGVERDIDNVLVYASFFDLQTMKRTKRVKINDFYVFQNYTCSPTTGGIAFDGDDGFYIYKDNTFTNPVRIIEPKVSGWFYQGMTLTDNNRLHVAVPSTADSYNARIYDAATGLLLYQIPLDKYFDTDVYFSPNGKYMCTRYGTQLHVYQLNDTDAQLLYSKNIGTNYVYTYFNPLNSNELIMCDGNYKTNFSIMDIASQTVRKVIDGRYISTDPYTGNIARLANDYDSQINPYLEILSSDASKILCKIRVSAEWFNLRNNYLIYGDYYINLSHFIK
ncbi:MAG: hypothetical protein ACK5M3_08225 [Dysgonomonas sp.]